MASVIVSIRHPNQCMDKPPSNNAIGSLKMKFQHFLQQLQQNNPYSMETETILKLEDMPILVNELIKQINQLNSSIQELNEKNAGNKEFRVYTIKEVSELLGLKEATIRTKIKNGELGASYIGKSYVFTQEDIDKFLAITHVESIFEREQFYQMN